MLREVQDGSQFVLLLKLSRQKMLNFTRIPWSKNKNLTAEMLIIIYNYNKLRMRLMLGRI